MKMYHYEVWEVGRESVKSVNASILATLIKELVNKYEKRHGSKSDHRKYYIKCKEKLEFTPKKMKTGDDEGFESDANEEESLSGEFSSEDARSTASSCCLVEDHVFRGGKSEVTRRNSCERDPTSLTSVIGSVDSANSSGGSDTDELDVHSLTPSPVSQCKKEGKSSPGFILEEDGDKRRWRNKREEYPIADVIFCHTEPKYPTVIAWVIKKQQCEADYGSRLGTAGVENFSRTENCLEVIVVKCRNGDSLKELCSNYQEYSKRIKLDQYKTIKRKRDEKFTSSTLSPAVNSNDVKVSLSDMKIANSCLIKASELSILKPKIMTSFSNDLKNSVSLNSLIRPEQTTHNVRVNQDAKVSVGPASHASVKKTQSLTNLSKAWDLKCDGPSRSGGGSADGSPAPEDRFNLVQRTDLNGVTHLEVSKARVNKPALAENFTSSKSKLRKEIEGVILIDVESYAKREQIRQRQGSEGGEPRDEGCEGPPPVRPERKKYLRKKGGAPRSDDVPAEGKAPGAQVPRPAASFFLNLPGKEASAEEQKVVRGPYVRAQSWGRQNARESGSGGWGGAEAKGRVGCRFEERCPDRRRSKSAGRAPRRTPMAYRYVDVSGDYRGNAPTKYGPRQTARELLEDPPHIGRRRKSFDDLITIDNLKGNLKSVIKKNKRVNDKYCEPKKVTFSAFATVQVVD